MLKIACDSRVTFRLFIIFPDSQPIILLNDFFFQILPTLTK